MNRTRLQAVIFWAFLLISLVFSTSAYADIWMKQKQHTGSYSMMGQTVPANDVVSKTWITKDWMRTDTSDRTTVIIRHDKGTIYVIDHKTKTYNEMPLNIGKAMDDSMDKAMQGMSEEQKKYMSSMMQGMMKFSMQITPTKEKKKIGDWKCRKYLQRMDTAMGPINSELWATKDIKMDYELLNRYNAIMMTNQPGMRESLKQVEKEMDKIDGMPVMTSSTTTIMGTQVKTTTELQKFIKAKAPNGYNVVPKGYKKQQ